MHTPPQLIATCWTTAGTATPGPTTGVSPLPLSSRIKAASDGGWDGFGLVHADLMAFLAGASYADLRHLLNDNGITHLELELIEDWWAEDERRPGSDRVRADIFAAAEALGAQTVKVGPDTSGRPIDPARFAASFGQLAAEAHEHGTRVAIEFLPFASHCNSLEAAIELVTEVAHPAGGICMDIWHVARAGTEFSVITDSLPGQYLFSVELNDAAKQSEGTLFEDTVHRRLLPGTGSFDVPAFIQAVRETGFTGMWGVEMLSDRHRSLPLEAGLAEARDATLACFAEADRRQAAKI